MTGAFRFDLLNLRFDLLDLRLNQRCFLLFGLSVTTTLINLVQLLLKAL